MVVRERPVASATAHTPPRPRDWASTAPHRRRERSFNVGKIPWYFILIHFTTSVVAIPPFIGYHLSVARVIVHVVFTRRLIETKRIMMMSAGTWKRTRTSR